MEVLTIASNSRNATSRYPVLSRYLSVQLQATYAPPFVHLLYSHDSPFSLSRCSSLALNVDLLSASSVFHTVFTSYLCIPQTVASNTTTSEKSLRI